MRTISNKPPRTRWRRHRRPRAIRSARSFWHCRSRWRRGARRHVVNPLVERVAQLDVAPQRLERAELNGAIRLFGRIRGDQRVERRDERIGPAELRVHALEAEQRVDAGRGVQRRAEERNRVAVLAGRLEIERSIERHRVGRGLRPQRRDRRRCRTQDSGDDGEAQNPVSRVSRLLSPTSPTDSQH